MSNKKARREFEVVNNANARVITLRVVLTLDDGDAAVEEALSALNGYGYAVITDRATVTNSFEDACAVLKTQAV